MVPIEPSTSARSLMRRALIVPSTSHGVLAAGGQSHVAHTELAQALDVLLAVPSPVVGVGMRRFAKQRRYLLDRLRRRTSSP